MIDGARPAMLTDHQSPRQEPFAERHKASTTSSTNSPWTVIDDKSPRLQDHWIKAEGLLCHRHRFSLSTVIHHARVILRWRWI